MTVTQVSAQELFQAAYENRYTWDSDFPGYTADVTYRRDGEVFTGRVRVNPDLKAQVFEIADETATHAIQGQLFEIAIHRVRRSFADTHSKNTFAYGDSDQTGATTILMGGKAEGDYYQVRDNEVCLVHRHIHGVVVTIHTFSSHDTGEGYLSHRYDSVYHDPKTGEQKGGQSVFEDSYEKVGHYQILSERQIQTEESGQTSTQVFQFSSFQLLGSRGAGT
ncbi:DUF3386 family protein [Synechococcales cyanobacterium C]|uniref:DUF3386 family protein n=1 Tax=Petrachloros mirabilis ULC683 TaxID=2781853 RepID=A0A8K2A7R9_9CYAN|nr:DUF3386 domain-containing protein [Petrachloros mirabilis]NCJ06489.1 DUF3386 family protein [Petrachloros mirabilis ULC683]